ncbi:neural cell adhesion molecule 1-like isoform X2 [Antedon mediterranea]|uniref:neural cell adhesion molecule 1-like isoform X2 n=1 Tax=Antedon mediterranea TaxID=105859 RepID=UPI003AF8EBEB
MILSCWADGIPTPFVTWFRADNRQIQGQLVPDECVATIVIANITLQHAGKYICYANNSLGHSTQKEIEVIVQFRPTAVAVKPVLRYSLDDEFVTLACKINAIPNATLKWFKDGSELDTTKDKHQLRFPLYCPDDGLMKFVLLTVKPRDYGNYTCMATNPLGNGRSSILLSARPVAPIIVSSPIGTMMHEYILKWQVNSTFRLPPVKQFKIQYKLEADSIGKNFNESETEWKHNNYTPRKEDSQENVVFNTTLENLRKNSTYFVIMEATNSAKPPERGEAAFFQFKTSAKPIEVSSIITSQQDTTFTKTTASGAGTAKSILTSFRKNQRKASTLHAPTNPGLVRMTSAVAEATYNEARTNRVASILVIICVLICKFIML